MVLQADTGWLIPEADQAGQNFPLVKKRSGRMVVLSYL